MKPNILQPPLKMMIEALKGRGENGSEQSAVASTTVIHNGHLYLEEDPMMKLSG